MDTQVKERLTGAVLLVALMVLLVPELLSGPSTAPARTPRRADEPPMRSYSIDLVDGSMKQTVVPEPQAAQLSAALVRRAEAPSAVAPQAVKPQAVTPAPVTEESPASAAAEAPLAAATPEPPPVTGWSIQVGSFGSRDNAQRLVKELKTKGFAAFMLEGGGKSGKLYRVRVGPAADRVAAAALGAKLRDAGKPGAVVPHP